MRYWGVVLALTVLLSAEASANMFDFFRALLESVQVATTEGSSSSSGSDGSSDSSDSGSNSDDSGSGSGDLGSGSSDPSYSYTQCMLASQSDSYDTQCMLTALVDEIIIPNYDELVVKVESFSRSAGPLETYCSAISTATESEALADAQLAWRDLAKSVQRSEMHAIGPASENGSTLQYRLNSYMSGELSTCGVDGIAASVGEDLDINTRSLNQRGIGAIGYLLFNGDLNHSCPPQVSSTQGWNDLSSADKKLQRCSAAVAISKDLAEAAGSLQEAWDPTGRDYRAEFLADDSVAQSLQEVTNGIFYLEEATKDEKLGKPLGIIAACPQRTCPEQVESPYSANSVSNIITNLQIFKEIFLSNSETGFDAHIENERFPEVAQNFETNLAKAIDFAETIDVSVKSQVDAIVSEAEKTECTNAFSNPDTPSDTFPMCTLYGLVKRIVDDLKIDFVSIVNVDVPGGSQADND